MNQLSSGFPDGAETKHFETRDRGSEELIHSEYMHLIGNPDVLYVPRAAFLYVI